MYLSSGFCYLDRYYLLFMETDIFYWQLLRKLPETLFALLSQPLAKAAMYRFDA